MTDIAPELLERVRSAFKLAYETNTVLSDIFQRVEEGTASYVDAHAYAARVGELLASAIRESISPEELPDGRMYYNIARRVLDPLLRENYELAADVAVRVQESLSRKAGLGLNAVRPKLSEDRIRGIVDTASSAEQYVTVSAQVQAQAVNFTQSAVDDTLHANVDAQGKAGLRPRIVRRAHAGCCKWCAALAGEYDYPTISREVYQRHENCSCTTEYDPGYGRRRQNVWDKSWTSPEDSAKIEERKTAGLETAEMYRRKIGEHGQEIIDKPTFNKLTRDFVRRGGMIIRGEEAVRHLESTKAYAGYMVGGFTAYIRDDATITDVLEEMYHAEQDRTHMFGEVFDYHVHLLREVDAQKYLLNVADRYKIPSDERESIRKMLAFYEEKLLRYERGEI